MSIPAKFQQLLENHPEHVLFEGQDRQLTAVELDQRSTALATHLQQLDVSVQSNVAILLPRGIEATIAIYAALKMGACYLPLDPQSPESRQSYIIRNAAVSCLIGQGESPSWVKEAGLRYVDIAHQPALSEGVFSPVHIHTEDRAALLYTSGSTGLPKGVALSHRAILAFAQWGKETFSISPTDRIASLAPYHFDLSLFDLFTGPLAGATTITLPDRLKLAPGKLVDWLISERISSWYTVPSLLNFILLKGGLATKNLPQLRQVLFAGEVFPTSQLKKLSQLLPTSRLFNLFGPTETNVCLYWPVQAEQLESDDTVPIGVPACDADLRIDPANNELLVKGPCLMSGYWNDNLAELPLDSEGWFHTGDKVTINPQGDHQYHGRLDRMIKSAGYRIEPAEIEMALCRVSGVNACAVVSIADAISGSRIIAVVSGNQLNQMSLRKHARESLPMYMQPAAYLLLETLPMLSNGKIDYRKIQQMVQKPAND